MTHILAALASGVGFYTLVAVFTFIVHKGYLSAARGHLSSGYSSVYYARQVLFHARYAHLAFVWPIEVGEFIVMVLRRMQTAYFDATRANREAVERAREIMKHPEKHGS